MWESFYSSGIMGIGWSGIGDLSIFESKDDMKIKLKEVYGEQYSYKNAAHATWQFAKEMKPGDIVFVKKGMYKIIGKGIVTGEYKYQPSEEDGIQHMCFCSKIIYCQRLAQKNR